ncbi:hypothetical protein P2318_16645 [Myxococcaceae bacterium GXIMD 01537]
MADAAHLALEAARNLRRSPGYASLPLAERQSLDRDLRRIEDTLRVADPYAFPMATPGDLQRDMQARESGGGDGGGVPQNRAAPAPGGQPAQPPGTAVIGERARNALAAVDFTSFVAGLVTGTFRSIVDATSQQVREYADLVASISRSVDDFSRDNVSLNQVRDALAQRHPADLQVVVPPPGKAGTPRLVPRRAGGEPPAWLAQYGLGDQELSEELTEGPLLEAGRRLVGEERLQTLATMVLMGINRIVINEGSIRAKLQFHASAKESTRAELATNASGQAVGIAARQVQLQSNTQTMVSTVNVNAQADVAIKADLVGEVSITFRTETFPLERFADSAAIQLINSHARWQAAPAAAPNGAAPAAPAPGAPPRDRSGGNA